jgi:hypothetical protein
MIVLDRQLSLRLRDLGCAQTLLVEPAAWKAWAMAKLRVYAAEHRAFTAEQFRVDFLSRGNPNPHTHKVWGALFKHADRQKVIEHTGRYKCAASPRTHGHRVAIWRASAANRAT